MTVPSYTEEDVELVARCLFTRVWGRTPTDDELTTSSDFDIAIGDARAVLDALSSSGRLVPPGSEVREDFGIRWNHGGEVLGVFEGGESAQRIAGDRGIALTSKCIYTPWSPWSPSVPDTEEGS